MAAAVTDLVCDRLGVTRDCETASTALPGANDPGQLDEFVERYDAAGPADAELRRG